MNKFQANEEKSRPSLIEKKLNKVIRPKEGSMTASTDVKSSLANGQPDLNNAKEQSVREKDLQEKL